MARRSKDPADRLSRQLMPADDAEFIELARARFKQAEQADEKQRIRELEDLEFYAGKQWRQEVLDARQGQPGNATSGLPPVPARPCLTINKVREPVRQVLNAERESELGVEIAAADDFGDQTPGVTPEEIELREGLVRRIQRESQAADARSWAFARATIAGRGYYRVMTRFAGGKSFDQEVEVQRIYNQASVSLDPTHEQPDGSDAEWGFIGTDLPWDRYRAEFGTVGEDKNRLTTMSTTQWRALGDELPGWFKTEGETRSVRVVEYWYVDRVTRTLVQLADGSAAYDDELPDGAELARDEDGGEVSRSVIEKRIKWAKIDGVQVLDETEWEGKYIPIIKVLGEELQPFDQERRAEGMVRPARDSQQAYNVMVSKWVEQIGLAPIPPWIMADGQDENFENEWALSTTRTLPTLHYRQIDSDGRPAPPPSRTSITMEIQAIGGSVQLFDQAIRSTTAVPDVTNLDPQINSDKQLKRILTQSEQATSHYLSNLTRSLRYEGLIINDLLYPIYGRPGRMARLMNPQGETVPALVGQPFVPHPQTKQPMTVGPDGQPVTAQTPNAQQYTLTPDATFNVTVKVTKNFDTRREEQESTLGQLLSADPQQMQVVGDLLWKYSDAPGHEELEKRYRAVLLPAVQAAITGQQAPDPRLQQLAAENQQLKSAIESKTAEKQVQGQFDLQKAQIDAQTKIEVARINAESAFAVADLKATLEAANTAIAAMQAERLALESSKKDAALQVHQATHEAAQNQADRAHELGMAAVDHATTLAQADEQHAQALAQGQQAGAIQSQQAAQQAALQPAPTGE